MHELSIAVSLLDRIEELARTHGTGPVERVRLRVGALAGVVPEALRFSFEVAREGTVAAGADLVVEEVPARARCVPCGADYPLGSPPSLLCPRCDGADVELLAGRELEIVAVEFAESGAGAGPGGDARAAPPAPPGPEEAKGDVPCG